MKALAALTVLAMLSGCDNGGSSGGNNDSGTNNDAGTGTDGGTHNDGGTVGYQIGGAILTAGATGLVLATPGEPNLTIPHSYLPAFHFANRVPTGTAYNVTVFSQPSSSDCNNAICTCSIIDGGVGIVGTSDVDTVQVTCAIQLP